jgi:hypothetical protein
MGEQTYGPKNASTTELIYEYLAATGVPESAFPAQHPSKANATPQQVDWLAREFGDAWHGRPPVLMGHAHHWSRIAWLCRMHKLEVMFVDAAAYLRQNGALTPQQAEAAALYAAHGRRYEETAMMLTRFLAPLGAHAVTAAFRVMTRVRTPTVVDVQRDADGRLGLYATSARGHARRLHNLKAA